MKVNVLITGNVTEKYGRLFVKEKNANLRTSHSIRKSTKDCSAFSFPAVLSRQHHQGGVSNTYTTDKWVEIKTCFPYVDFSLYP